MGPFKYKGAMRSTLRVVTMGAILAVATPARAQSAEVQKYLNAAVTLYENLEYEKALQQIERARARSTQAGDDARIALYEGIVYADMGKDEAHPGVPVSPSRRAARCDSTPSAANTHPSHAASVVRGR